MSTLIDFCELGRKQPNATDKFYFKSLFINYVWNCFSLGVKNTETWKTEREDLENEDQK